MLTKAKKEQRNQEQENSTHLSWAFRLFNTIVLSSQSTVLGNIVLMQHIPSHSSSCYTHSQTRSLKAHFLFTPSPSNVVGTWGANGRAFHSRVYLVSERHPRLPTLLSEAEAGWAHGPLPPGASSLVSAFTSSTLVPNLSQDSSFRRASHGHFSATVFKASVAKPRPANPTFR